MHDPKLDDVLILDGTTVLREMMTASRRVEAIDTLLIEATAEPETDPIIAV